MCSCVVVHIGIIKYTRGHGLVLAAVMCVFVSLSNYNSYLVLRTRMRSMKWAQEREGHCMNQPYFLHMRMCKDYPLSSLLLHSHPPLTVSIFPLSLCLSPILHSNVFPPFLIPHSSLSLPLLLYFCSLLLSICSPSDLFLILTPLSLFLSLSLSIPPTPLSPVSTQGSSSTTRVCLRFPQPVSL